ncbi:MAG TPA: TAT-variant-translocated molybdopterin oxidoreductase, partial [Holophagaceae bacterium]|nr:TAT-variant-translocated molybdopterin oxidoreductase [Holophagaceae bacterium]
MPRFWKSLASRRAPSARQDEFPEELPVGESVRKVSRRDFFRWSGLGFAVGLATGCDHKKAEKAMSFLQGQEGITPGTDLWYATTSLGCPCGCGALAKVRDGRPIKLEGNPEHPLGRGALCTVGQAQVRSLYDGGRQPDPVLSGRTAAWADLDRDLVQKLEAIRQGGGKVRVLSSTVLSPSLRKAIARFTSTFKDGRHVTYDALSASALLDAYARTHGQRLMPAFRLEQADVIVGVEADFLGAWIAPGPFGRAYALRRNPDAKEGMSRHIQVESG